MEENVGKINLLKVKNVSFLDSKCIFKKKKKLTKKLLTQVR